MKQYVALVDYEDGSAYGIRFPDVPGVFAASDDEDGVMAAAVEALSLYAEDEALPDPRPVSAVRKEVVEDLAQGALLMLVPSIVRSRKVTRVNLSIDKGTLAAIDAGAKSRKQTRSAFIAEAALAELEGHH